MISGFSFSPSKHIKHVVMFSLPLITVTIHLSIHKVPLLLIGRVCTTIKLVRVVNLIDIVSRCFRILFSLVASLTTVVAGVFFLSSLGLLSLIRRCSYRES